MKKNLVKATEQPKKQSFSEHKFYRKSSAVLIKPQKDRHVPEIRIDEVDVVVYEGAAISSRVEAEGTALLKSSSNGEICTTARKQTSALKLAGLTKVSVKSPQPRRQKSLF